MINRHGSPDLPVLTFLRVQWDLNQSSGPQTCIRKVR